MKHLEQTTIKHSKENRSQGSNNGKSKRLLLSLLLALGLIALAPTAAGASTTDPTFSDSDSEYVGGKYVSGSATYTRNDNRLHFSAYISNPYWWVGAFAEVNVTIYADTFFGKYPLWQEVRQITACGTWDPTCASEKYLEWDAYPSWDQMQRIQEYGSSMVVDTTLR